MGDDSPAADAAAATPIVQPQAGWRWPAAWQRLAAWLLLGLSLGATVLAWNLARRSIERDVQAANEKRLIEVQLRLLDRIAAYEQVLKAAALYVSAVPGLDAAAWQSMVDKIELKKNFPGLEGLGFATALPAGEKPLHEERQRKRLQNDYVIRPLGSRTFYAPLDLIVRTGRGAPPTAGFDMYSEPRRRAAMEIARSSGKPALSDRVLLKAHTDDSEQTGLLLFVPAFRSAAGSPALPPAQRSLIGWVSAPIRLDLLMATVLAGTDIGAGVRITDSSKMGADALIYADYSALTAKGVAPASWSKSLSLDAGGRHWSLQMAFAPPAGSLGDSIPGLILASGSLLSCFLFAGVMGLLEARRKIIHDAQFSQAGLREEHGRLQAHSDQQASQLQAVMDSSPCAIVTVVMHQFRSVNLAAAAMFGYRPEEMIGQSTRLVFASEDAQQACIRKIAEGLDNAPAMPLHEQLVARDGRAIHCSGTVTTLEHGHPQRGMVVVFQDLGERLRLDQLLEESQNFSSRLFDLAPVGLALAHMDGRMIAVNRAYAGLFGYSEDQARTLNYWDITPLEHGEFEKLQIEALATPGESVSVEKQVLRADGRRLPVRLQLQVTERHGEPLIWAAVENLEIEKASEQRLDAYLLQIEAQQRRLEDYERSKLEMLGNVSHDLSTPLNAIVGFSELLVEGIPQPLEPEQKKYAQQILTASRELLELIRVIVIFSSNTTSAVPAGRRLALDSIDIAGFMTRRLDGFKAAAAAKRIAIDLDVAADGLTLLAEREYLRIIADSLLDHGIWAAPAGSRVRVRVGPTTHAPAGREADHERWLELSVELAGPSLDAGQQARLFEPFASAQAETERPDSMSAALLSAGGKRGLGLALALKLAAHLGGNIEIANTPRGNILTALVPWREPVPQAA